MVSDLIGAQASTWDKLSSISRAKKIGSAYLFSGPVVMECPVTVKS